MRRQGGLDADLPAQTPSVGAISVVSTLHRQRRQKLINAREKTPEKLDLRVDTQLKVAGPALVHTQKGAKKQTKWWRGRDLNPRPSGYEPDELPDCSTPRRSLQDTNSIPSAPPDPAPVAPVTRFAYRIRARPGHRTNADRPSVTRTGTGRPSCSVKPPWPGLHSL